MQKYMPDMFITVRLRTPSFGEPFTDATEDHTVNNYSPTRYDETLIGPDRHNAFGQAVVEGQVPRIRHFLRMGADVDETGASGLTVLHRAVLSSHENVIEILIEAGADVNAMSDDFGTALCLAALRGAHEILRDGVGTNLAPVRWAKTNIILPDHAARASLQLRGAL